MRDLLTTDVSILGAPLVVTGLARLLDGDARVRTIYRPFFNVVISNVPGPRQTMYCVGAPATHYFPVSIPYHGCALNITVQSYLDQLDFGLIACSETVPDAQRIADFIVEDFAAMREGRCGIEPTGGDRDDRGCAERRLGSPRTSRYRSPKRRRDRAAPKAEKTSALTRQIDALSAATEAAARKLAKRPNRRTAQRRGPQTEGATKRKRAA